MSKEKREEIEAFPIGPFRMMKCDEEEVRELEADYTKLQEERDKAVELIKRFFRVDNELSVSELTLDMQDFLNQLEDKEK